jgi:hypothetical protein
MRGLKRKRQKFSRNFDRCSGGHQKDSAFDYAAYRTEEDIPIGNVQQIRATIAPIPKSPLKKKVKRMLKAEVAKVANLQNQNDQLQKGVDLTQKKLTSLKDDNRKLAMALQNEKKKSRLTIAQLLDDIEVAIVESQQGVKSTKAVADAMVLLERQKSNTMLRKERAHHASEVAVRECNNIASTIFAFCSSPRFHGCICCLQ